MNAAAAGDLPDGHAAGGVGAELKDVLKKVLEKTKRAGQKLLSMNLHLFPVKEWQLGGEVSVGLLKGTISVTFGKGT